MPIQLICKPVQMMSVSSKNSWKNTGGPNRDSNPGSLAICGRTTQSKYLTSRPLGHTLYRSIKYPRTPQREGQHTSWALLATSSINYRGGQRLYEPPTSATYINTHRNGHDTCTSPSTSNSSQSQCPRCTALAVLILYAPLRPIKTPLSYNPNNLSQLMPCPSILARPRRRVLLLGFVGAASPALYAFDPQSCF